MTPSEEAVIQLLESRPRPRPRARALLALFCVLGAPLRAVPAPAWVDAPLPPGLEALSRFAGFEQAPPRLRLLEELTRRLHAPYGEYALRPVPPLAPGSDRARVGAPTVRVPLPREVWAAAVFERPVPLDGLIAAILEDRVASRLYRGLATLDEPTLLALAAEPRAVRRICRAGADAFAVFGRSLSVADGRVATPGGPSAAGLWEQLVGEPPSQPARFIARLMTRDGGRLAELYDLVARLDAPHRDWVLGARLSDAQQRLAQLDALRLVLAQDPPFWRELRPLSRVWPDAAEALRAVPLDPNGRPLLAGADPQGALAPAHVLAELLPGDTGKRELRLLRLGFAPAAGLSATNARQAFEKRPMLGLALRGLGLDASDALLAASRQAEVLEGLSGARGLSQYESLLALLLHARRSGGLAPARVRELAAALFEDKTVGAMACEAATHLAREWLPPEAAGESREQRLLRLVAGPEAPGTARFTWEGLDYRLDPGGAELQRLQRWRRLQPSAPLDVSIAACAAIKRGGAAGLAEARQLLQAAAGRRQQTNDGVKLASASPGELRDEADRLLTDALRDLVYALALAQPERAAAAAAQARRHDFEIGQSGLQRGPWSLPAELRGPGRPRYVRGSLLGLELALAERGLRRLGSDLPEHPPSLYQDYYLPLARAAGVLAREIPEGSARAVAAALARGRERVKAAAGDAGALDRLALEARLPAWKRRVLAWAAAAEPEESKGLFGLAELARLGGLEREPLGAPWGWPALEAAGVLGPRLDLRVTPDDLLGLRPGPALVAALPDLQLRVAELVAEAGLPDALAAGLLPLATQELIERVQVQGLDDTAALQRWAAALPRERLDDYLPALVATGFLVPVFDSAD